MPYLAIYTFNGQVSVNGGLSSALSSISSGFERFPLMPSTSRYSLSVCSIRIPLTYLMHETVVMVFCYSH
jgi:hypothetical protein